MLCEAINVSRILYQLVRIEVIWDKSFLDEELG